MRHGLLFFIGSINITTEFNNITLVKKEIKKETNKNNPSMNQELLRHVNNYHYARIFKMKFKINFRQNFKKAVEMYEHLLRIEDSHRPKMIYLRTRTLGEDEEDHNIHGRTK